jgi:tetratricopeptide (TPR) repeat protein
LIESVINDRFLGAETEFRSALTLYAGNPAWVHDWCGFFFPYNGRLEDSISQFQQALELDPLSAAIHNDFGGVLWLARPYDQAIDQWNKILEIEPTFTWAYGDIGQNLLAKRQFPEAMAAFRKASVGTFGMTEEVISAQFGYAYALSGEMRR